MEWIIIIILGFIAYAVWDIYVQVKDYIKYKSAFDPDYPIYSAREIWVSKIKLETSSEIVSKKWNEYEEYYKSHKEEIEKIKKNKDQSQELKNIMSSYHYSADELNNEVEHFRHMIDVNYQVRNNRITYSETCQELSNTFKNIKKILNKKSGYNAWLEYEEIN